MEIKGLSQYLVDNKILEKSTYDWLKYELEQRAYYYGEHFKYPKEGEKINKIKALIKNIYAQIYTFRPINGEPKIISNAYFSVNDELRKLNFNVYYPLWDNKRKYDISLYDFKMYQLYVEIARKLREYSFNLLIKKELLIQIEKFKDYLNAFYMKNNVNALFVPNDLDFYNRLSIDVFKELKRPTFIFLHGLPARYNKYDESRTNYLIVWGGKIKENYVKAGHSEDRIYVSGHPYYQKLDIHKLKSSLDDVLVITKAMSGAQHSDKVRVSDRSNSLLYLYSIQHVLEQAGVKRARLRVHPSENINWYLKFVDSGFYHADCESLDLSLKRASIVIGPTSTVLLETVYYGKNYIVYEPTINNIDLMNYELAPPFDGSDDRIPVAKSEGDLLHIIKNRETINIAFWKDYIQTPFNIDFVKKIIK